MYKKLIEAMLGAYIGKMYIKLTDHFKILQLLDIATVQKMFVKIFKFIIWYDFSDAPDFDEQT